jgi:hypothetical protein
LRITLRKYRNTILLSNTLLSVVFCTALAPSAYAGGDIFCRARNSIPAMMPGA